MAVEASSSQAQHLMSQNATSTHSLRQPVGSSGSRRSERLFDLRTHQTEDRFSRTGDTCGASRALDARKIGVRPF
jgi:hypothetical protein